MHSDAVIGKARIHRPTAMGDSLRAAPGFPGSRRPGPVQPESQLQQQRDEPDEQQRNTGLATRRLSKKIHGATRRESINAGDDTCKESELGEDANGKKAHHDEVRDLLGGGSATARPARL